MAQIIGIILFICAAYVAFQLALILLVVAGLIFRTKETIGLMLFFGALGLFSKYPLTCLAVGAAGVAFCLFKKRAERRTMIKPDAPPALTDDTAG